MNLAGIVSKVNRKWGQSTAMQSKNNNTKVLILFGIEQITNIKT